MITQIKIFSILQNPSFVSCNSSHFVFDVTPNLVSTSSNLIWPSRTVKKFVLFAASILLLPLPRPPSIIAATALDYETSETDCNAIVMPYYKGISQQDENLSHPPC
jgi:hypothetical protein